MSACPRCGRDGYHYMTHLCADCTCRAYEVRIPGEPHIPAYLDAELDPACPAHSDALAEVGLTEKNTEKETNR